EKTAIHLQTQRTLKQVVWGTVVLVVMIILLMVFGYRKIIHLFEIASDSKNAADEFSHDAFHDMLTQLPNRRYFETHLKRMVNLNKRNRQSFALFYLDLDGFKQINDQYGHDAGDEALIFAAGRFKAALRESDFLARLGGDEFAVIIEQYFSIKELNGLSGRILRYLNQSFIAAGHTCQLGVSIGISCYPANGKDMESLINAADSAMYKAKKAGKGRAVFA
ncbi:MAG: diguanylate cyclase, partial [Methylophilaceae bacterium]